MKLWWGAAVICLVLCAGRAARADDDPDARTAYDKANAVLYDASQERTPAEIAQACELLEDSIAIQPRIVSLHALGVCYDKLGQVASAYGAFNRAASYVLTKEELKGLPEKRQKKRKSDHASLVDSAGKYLKAHRPSQLKVVLGNDAKYVADLSLQIQRQQVDEAWQIDSTPHPVKAGALENYDGGQYVVTATAAGYLPWSQLITVDRENGTHKLVVELLQHEPKPDPVVIEPETTKVDPVVEAPPDEPLDREVDDAQPVVMRDAPSAFTSQRKIAVGLGVVGLGLGIAGLVFELQAIDICPDRGNCATAADSSTANQKENLAIGLGIGAGVMVAAGVVLWITGGPDEPSDDRVTLVPTLGDDQAGIAALGRF